MLKKALTKSGIRILKAIKKLSTKTYVSSKKKKSSQTTSCAATATTTEAAKTKISSGQSSWRSAALPDHEAVSLSWSMMSLDTKSVDTYVTMVSENVAANYLDFNDDDDGEQKCCCCCAEYEQNQRNENRENEMFV